MRKPVKWGLCLLPVSLGLFFGLFFGVSYPEIVRFEWPLTKCDIRSANIDSRYCCERVCSGCKEALTGAQSCSARISSINNAFSPGVCAGNSSACPSRVGDVCDGGYYCCRECCQTCQRCTNTCSSSAPTKCSRSCTSYSCNCRCCSSVSHRQCTLQCPPCFSVNLGLTFYTGRMRNQPHNTTYSQDFKKDEPAARAFFSAHSSGSRSSCHYNPKTLNEVSFDVSFTAWKWAVVAIFGILPLFANLAFFAAIYALIPLKGRAAEWYRQRRIRRQLRPVPQQDQDYHDRITVMRDDDGKAYALDDRNATAHPFQANASIASSRTQLYDDPSPPGYAEAILSKAEKYSDSAT